GNLCAPPLHFGRRPPQSNYPPDAVPAPDHGSGLEAQNTKGGIPRLAPRGLASPLQSLPPILDNESQTPTSSCSKGSRGLSVQPRVFGIFTETTVSPDPSLRQHPSRYSIRAGRNFALPPPFPEAQTIPSPWLSCASIASGSYRLL